jgi:hypothetical protein
MKAVFAFIFSVLMGVCLASPALADPRVERCSYERTIAPKLSPNDAHAVLFLNGQALLRRCVSITDRTGHASLEYIGATKVANGVCRVSSVNIGGDHQWLRTYAARRRDVCPAIDIPAWTLLRTSISDRDFLAIDQLLENQCAAIPDFKYGNGTANFRSSCRKEAWRAFEDIGPSPSNGFNFLRSREFEIETNLELPEAHNWSLRVHVDWRGKVHIDGISQAYV